MGKTKQPQLKTARATIACAKCRHRKVRCDVSRRGHPCSNCELDYEECVVLPKRRMSRLKLYDNTTGVTEPMPRDKESPVKEYQESTASEPNMETRWVDIPFQAYRFVKSDFLCRLPQDEIAYLDSQSCFRLPVRASWDSMINAYFKHINPLMPVIDEKSFWEQSRGNGSETISLFVAQAILFAACPFADARAIQGCGFSNCREARAVFYHRAKLLYRLESERHPINIIKGSLLLSLCSSPQIENPVNSIWLSIAIQHARSMGAHYLKPQGTSLWVDWLQLKRLWWACLVRDRLIALGYRRPLQISEEDLDTELAIISSDEIDNYLCYSEVHSVSVRRTLLFIFISFCRLCIPLTRILKLIVNTSDQSADKLDEADKCADSLKDWLEATNIYLDALELELRTDDLIVLHYHLIQIYFHAAYVHVLNFKIMTIQSIQPRVDGHRKILLQTGATVQASVEAIADILATLEQHDLVGLLPISAVMCIVLPFVLHSMQVKLVPSAQASTASQQRTESFLQLIQCLQVRQNNVNPVTNVIEQVITFIQPRKPMADWKQLISSQPDYYLRVLKTLDLALSTGRFPCNTIPMSLNADDQLRNGPLDEFIRTEDEAGLETNPVIQEETCPLDITKSSYGSSIFQSLWPGEEDLFSIDGSMMDFNTNEPILRDLLDLCNNHDFESSSMRV